MAEYQPEFFPGDIITLIAGEAVVGGQLVRMDTAADRQVLLADDAEDAVVGVVAADAAITADVQIYGLGVVHRLVAQGAITRGDRVTAGTVAGTVATSAAQGAGYVQADANRGARAEIGIALESIADTATGRVMFR